MRRMSEPESGEYYEVQALTGRLRVVVAVGVVLVVAAGIALRFWSPSALWLDEALTVNIARLPLHEIPGRLKQDGAPPLFYYLLHFWMRLFGQSDWATRSLSGLMAVLTLPVAWLAAKRFGGRTVAWTTLVLLASAPFAVYYATEARMYALVILLTACGVLALQGALSKPRPGNLIAVGVVTAALLYAQYWSLYLVGMVGLWLLLSALRARHRSPRSKDWRRPIPALVAVAVGGLAFVPWLPTFIYQSKHTGTPWAVPTNFAGVVNAVTGFTYNQASLSPVSSNQGRVLALIYFALAALALFGIGRTGRIVELDLHTRPRARGITFVVIGTLFAAIAGGLLTSSAFSARYAAVVFLPFLLIVALGSVTLLNARGRLILLSVAVAAGLWISVQSVHAQRTQAPRVAEVLAAQAKPGDIIAFCPDQLGPSTFRLITNPSQYSMVTFPRGIGPQFIDWVDYAQASRNGHPVEFADNLIRRAGTTHHVWLVWEGGYQTFGVACERLTVLLQAAPGVTRHDWVVARPGRYYEPMSLSEYVPPPK
jgi:mannosyltransferase